MPSLSTASCTEGGQTFLVGHLRPGASAGVVA